MGIKVTCQCGQRFEAKEDLAGKTVRCPKCGGPLKISPKRGRACPSCRAEMPAGAVLCTSCGYSHKLGRRVETDLKRTERPPLARPPTDDRPTRSGITVTHWMIVIGMMVLLSTLSFCIAYSCGVPVHKPGGLGNIHGPKSRRVPNDAIEWAVTGLALGLGLGIVLVRLTIQGRLSAGRHTLNKGKLDRALAAPKQPEMPAERPPPDHSSEQAGSKESPWVIAAGLGALLLLDAGFALVFPRDLFEGLFGVYALFSLLGLPFCLMLLFVSPLPWRYSLLGALMNFNLRQLLGKPLRESPGVRTERRRQWVVTCLCRIAVVLLLLNVLQTLALAMADSPDMQQWNSSLYVGVAILCNGYILGIMVVVEFFRRRR